jgi:DNA-binding transcriptional ArsR family regulator
MPLAHRRVTDPAALRALAHPLRTTLLDLLAAEGPRTATELARRLDASPSNCSWHLRKLAEHGFVREARGRSGRQRPWQAVSEGLAWSSDWAPDASDDVLRDDLVGDAVDDMRVEQELQRLRAARASRDLEPAAWREAGGLLHRRLWLTAEEAAALGEAVREVLDRYAAGDASPAERSADARPVTVLGWLVPNGPLPDEPG